MRSKRLAWTGSALGIALGIGTWLLPLGAEPKPADGYRFEQGPDVERQLREIAALHEAATRQPGVPEPDLSPPLDAPASGPPTERVYALEDGAGDPIVGAKARLWLLPGTLEGGAYWPRMATLQASGLFPTDEPPLTAVSGATGELRFADVPADRRVYVEVPTHDMYGAEGLFDTSSMSHRKVIRLATSDGPLTVRVSGLPAFVGTACAVIRSPRRAGLGSAVITSRWVSCVVPLDEHGAGVTPALRGGALQADVFLPGYGLACNLPVVRVGAGRAEIQLPSVATATLRGQLLDPEGHGVADARLALSVTDYLASPNQLQWCLFGHSQADGRFVLERVPVGLIDELYIDAPGFVTPRLVLEDAPLRPGDDVDVPIQLVPGTSAVGRVVDDQGAPVEGARVHAGHQRGGMSFWTPSSTWTDAQGRWRLDQLLPGGCKVTVSSPASSAACDVDITIRRGSLPRAPVARLPKVSTAGRVEVSVVRADGRPVSGANVSYRVARERSTGTVQTGPTDAEGRFVLAGLDPDFTSFGVWASKQGAQSAVADVVRADVEAQTAKVRLVLPAVGRIEGRVLLQGEPVPGVTVAVQDAPWSARTSEDGAYRIWSVAPGTWQLALRSPAGTSVGEPRSVTVKADEVVRVDLAYEPSESDAVIRGRLSGRDGQPLAGVWLGAKAKDAGGRPDPLPWHMAQLGTTVTDAQGRFELPVARPGLYRIVSGRRELRADVLTPTEALELQFDPAALRIVQGRVVDETGRRLLGGQVALHRKGGGREREVHGGGGVFRIELLPGPATDFHVDVYGGLVDSHGDEIAIDHQPVSFEPNETLILRANVIRQADPRVVALAGLVLTEDGRPLAGATLYEVEGPQMSSIAWSAADGTFTIMRKPPLAGGIELAVTAPAGYRATHEPRRIRFADGPLRIVVPKLTDAEIFQATVEVVDRDGLPVPGVRLETWGVASLSAVTDAEGRAVFPALLRGTWTIRSVRRFAETLDGYVGTITSKEVAVSPEKPAGRIQLDIRKRDPDREHDVVAVLDDPAGTLVDGATANGQLIGLDDRAGDVHRLERDFWGRQRDRLTFADIPQGRYRLEVSWEGLDPPYLPVAPIETRVPGGEIRVPLRRAAVLHGRVVGGASAEGLVSFLDPARGWWLYRPLAADGVFTLNVDPDASFTIYARHDGNERYGQVEDVKAASSPVEIRLDRAGITLRGRVHGLKRVPHDYELHAKGPLPHVLHMKLDEAGAFELRGAPPGTYEVVFESCEAAAFDGGSDWDTFRAHVTTTGESALELHPKRAR